MAGKNEVKDAKPHQKEKKIIKFVHISTDLSFVSSTVLSKRIHPRTEQALFIKWTTPGKAAGLNIVQSYIMSLIKRHPV